MERMSSGARVIAGLALLTACLYFGADLLMPLAVAILVGFLLAPVVSAIERIGLGRVPAVIVTLGLLVSLLGGTGWVASNSISGLAADSARYRENLRAKAQTLRGPLDSLSDAAKEIDEIQEELDEPESGGSAPKVEVVQTSPLAGRIGSFLTPVASSVGFLGLVVVLAVFLLLEREELRDRMIWLIGGRDLSLTTRALDDATARVSRYLGMQAVIAGIQGTAVAVGLAAIGIPGAVLWGALSFALRFLPYFGPWIAAALPIALSLAAFETWTPSLLTVGLFVVLELVSNNVLEPWLYGASVGLSPFAVVLSALFWATLWGLPGLLLATPLTVCLVVAGRYVRALEFFPALLSDTPVLSPELRVYQRLLALDLDEAEAVLRAAATNLPLADLGDRVVFPVLRRLAADDERGALTEEQARDLGERLGELLDELPAPAAAVAVPRPRVLLVPAQSESDALASRWIGRVLAERGTSAEQASPHALASEIVQRVGEEAPDLVCISALTPVAAARARLLCKRLPPGPTLIVGLWGAPRHEIEGHSAAAGTWIGTAAELERAVHSLRTRLHASEPSRPTAVVA